MADQIPTPEAFVTPRRGGPATAEARAAGGTRAILTSAPFVAVTNARRVRRAGPRQGPWSVRAYLICLIAGVSLPLLVFSSILIIQGAEHERETLAAQARTRTRLAAAAIQDELASLRARTLLLGGSLSLQTSDLNDFHARASESFAGLTVVLSSPSGQQIVNTALPYGSPLPKAPIGNAMRQVLETRQPGIGDLSVDPVTNRPAVTLNVPVTRDSRLVYVLSVDISPVLPRILSELELPAEWVGTIFDRRGVIIARTRDPDRYIGQAARPEFLPRIHEADSGEISGFSREGAPLISAFAHTNLGAWTIVVGIPRNLLLAPVREKTAEVLLLGAATLAIAITLAMLIGRRIVGPIMDLVPIAETLGRGEPVLPHASRLAEADAVSRSMVDASERLRRAADETRIAVESVRQSEQAQRAVAEDLARVDAERSDLVVRMVAVQEEERVRIARELHDSLAQYLTALRLKLGALRPVRAPGDSSGSDLVDELNRLVDELGVAVNRMAWELRLVAVEELGFSAAIGHYLEEWAERAHLRVDSVIDLAGQDLPPIVETTLFRVLQEAVTNVLRHAGATRVGIVLDIKGDDVRLIVEDDGKGFGTEAANRRAGHFGLVGMRERLALLHGHLDLETGPDQGTTLFIRVPLGQRWRTS